MQAIDDRGWRHEAWLNHLQSFVLLLGMAGFFTLLGWLLWGVFGVVALLLASLLGVLFNPGLSPRWVMALYGAVPIPSRRAPWLWSATAALSEHAQLPEQPALYYLPSRMLNAFAVGGRSHSAIAVSDGLLRALSRRELLGVLAHEMSHIRNNDLWVMGLADMFSRATSMLSLLGQLLLLLNLPLLLLGQVVVNWFAVLLLIFAPTLSALAQLALSRTREYDADLNAAILTADPDGLASALAKIEQLQGGWIERILMPGRRVPEPSLLRTHPETSERIARLMRLKSRRRAGSPMERDAEAIVHPDWREPVRQPPRWHINGLWY